MTIEAKKPATLSSLKLSRAITAAWNKYPHAKDEVEGLAELIDEATRLPELIAFLKDLGNSLLIDTDGRTIDGALVCTCQVHPELEALLVRASRLLAEIEGGQKPKIGDGHYWGGNPHSVEGPGHFPEDGE